MEEGNRTKRSRNNGERRTELVPKGKKEKSYRTKPSPGNFILSSIPNNLVYPKLFSLFTKKYTLRNLSTSKLIHNKAICFAETHKLSLKI